MYMKCIGKLIEGYIDKFEQKENENIRNEKIFKARMWVLLFVFLFCLIICGFSMNFYLVFFVALPFVFAVWLKRTDKDWWSVV